MENQQRTRIYGGAELKAKLDLPVVLLIAPFKEHLISEVATQCEKIGHRAVMWEDLSKPPLLSGKTPALLVADVPPGVRRIPDPIVVVMNSTFGDAPLLLLCSDVLHRPAISLQNGRVTLVGPPPSPSRLLARMRALLAGQVPGKRTNLEATELLSARWWVSAFAPSGSALPPLRQQGSEGVTALLPAAGAQVSDADLAQALAILRKPQANEEDHAQALAALLGGRAGLVHLSSAADRWTIYWPDLAGQVVLGSAERLPPQWDVAAALTRTGQRFARLSAAPGDTVAAATAALPAAGLAGSMADGGSAVVDVLDEHFAGAAGSFTGLVLEVR